MVNAKIYYNNTIIPYNDTMKHCYETYIVGTILAALIGYEIAAQENHITINLH